ncbi:MAG: hypothetical protein LBR26_05745 [Prevotella sp.]|jgi:hypothetical protein|nr:hypothetical protein [Prevotella sp.]
MKIIKDLCFELQVNADEKQPGGLDFHNRRSATCGQESPRQTLPERQDFDVFVLPFRQSFGRLLSAGR